MRLANVPLRKPGAPLLVGLALFLAALLVRLYRLGAQSLWLDEGSSWELSRGGWGHLLGELLNPTAAYPLYHLLLKGWMALFGDAEAALRMPSALAGALAVPVIYLAAVEVGRAGGAGAPRLAGHGLAAALIALAAPYTIWYGQEAKVYGLLLLNAALISWALPRALRTGRRRDWAMLGGLCLVALFVHRLAALLLLAVGVAALLVGAGPARRRPALWVGLAVAGAGLVAAMALGLGSESATTGAYIPAGPATALGLSFVRFAVDRWPGDGPWWWLLPWLALLSWGLGRALHDLRQAGLRRGAIVVLALLGVPLGLFLLQLVFTRVYEARYLILIFPAWALLLSYPLAPGVPERAGGAVRAGYGLLLAAALATGGLALFQPGFGLFSGDPVKEQYREAINELAVRVHPDDAVVIHPGYIRPLYDYYMGRMLTDPAPAPLAFANFWRGPTSYGPREWEFERRERLTGFARSFLLIAPEHARTVDVPLPGDEYGQVGLFWAYSAEQRTWPCGIWRYNGVHLLCQEAPEPYFTREPLEPATPSDAVFGDTLRLLGFTLKATTAQGPGVYRAGGNLPISLFWEVRATPATSYSFFLHLCRDCETPPLASDDGPPLEGYLPTTVWLPGKPARDDRTIHLPADLEPGRYTLLVGVFDPSDATPAGRLPVVGEPNLGSGRLVLGTVEIVAGTTPAAAGGVSWR
ncbi:MAG: glycosyltransferase family 39 protein [Chloroflexi bacterium]|nr:glycosyltransferase family 39 protein [Chloroflexota bacterium]